MTENMQFLRVNMTTLKVAHEDVPDEYEYMGGRGLTGKLLLKEGSPTEPALSKYNRLIFAIGPLAGTGVSGAGRLSVGGKSPLTGGIKESNCGGIVAERLAKLGIKAIIIEGEAKNERLYLLKVGRHSAEILPVNELKGLGSYGVVRKLEAKEGGGVGIISIGPAGENKFSSAAIFTTDKDGIPGCVLARGGLGAVMGHKGLKAIVIMNEGTYRIPIKNRELFQKTRRAFTKLILETPQTGEIWPKYGTAAVISTMNKLGGLVTKNFSQGYFEKADRICGEALYDLIRARGGKTTKACMPGCVIRCYNEFPDKDGKILVSPFQFETIAMLGSNLGIGDLDEIAYMNKLCNEYGVDTIEIGGAIGVAMEAGLIEFGDAKGAIDLIDEIGRATLLGRVLGEGVALTGRVLGVRRVPAVKGQGMPAHEPRAFKGTGVTLATSPMGADHTAGVTLRAGYPLHKPDKQVEVSRRVQTNIAGYDALGLCIFNEVAVGTEPSLIVGLLNAVYGTKLGSDYILKLGREVLMTEKTFNARAGFTTVDDRLPDFFEEEPVPPNNFIFDVPRKDLDCFWEGI